ncbi:MAG: hypothetical protein P8099_13130 [Gemmatimonadota bacterium]
MMMGTEWLIWLVVAVVVLRLVTRRGRWHRRWSWPDEWLDGPYGDWRLPPRGRRYGARYGRRRRLEGRRASLEEAADRLEEASERLRRKARGGRPMTDARRPTLRSSSTSEPGRTTASGASAGSASGNGSRAPARESTESRLEALQRRFAEGRITMDQYERELDKLYGLN